MSASAPCVESSGAGPWVDGILNGPSQVFFQRNITTGGLVFAAFFIADWRMGILAIIGAVGGMLGGRITGSTSENIASGMQSFCGTLVGAAGFAALGGGAWWGYVLAGVGGVATGPVTWAVAGLFATTRLEKYDLPYTTSPFVIVAGIIALSTVPLAVEPPPSDGAADGVPAFFVSLLTNVSQVVLVGSKWAGAVILLGLFLAHWKVGAAALLGSAVGSVTAIVLGESADVASGVTNYSGVLTAIALAVTFLESSMKSWLYSIPWIVVTAVVTMMMRNLELPAYTWPYILTTWVALVVAHYIHGLKRA